MLLFGDLFRTMALRNRIAIIHNLAKSGGTIISRSMGAMNSILLFSEIHPCGPSMIRLLLDTPELSRNYDIRYQAQAWYGIDDSGISEGESFVQVLRAITERASSMNRTVVLRSWSHIDFLGIPFTNPSGVCGLTQALEAHFELRHIGVLRHPVDQWLSMRTRLVYKDITLNNYLAGYGRFIQQDHVERWLTYESFVLDPDAFLKAASQMLRIEFDPYWSSHWQENSRITGDRMASGPVVREIRLGPKRPVNQSLLDQFWASRAYHEILSATGYKHPVAS